MPSSPSSSAQAARLAVAARLRDLMLDAGLRAGELAARCGWSNAKSSRIINAKTTLREFRQGLRNGEIYYHLAQGIGRD